MRFSGWLAATIFLVAGVAGAGELGTRELEDGDSGTDVVELQDGLRAAGFDPGPTDGKFGPKTERAVRSFQASAGLAVDGVVGTKTVAALDATKPASTDSTPAGQADGLPLLEQQASSSKTRRKGVDVSKYEGTVDWAKVKSAGYAFGIARVSDGIRTHDATFAR